MLLLQFAVPDSVKSLASPYAVYSITQLVCRCTSSAKEGSSSQSYSGDPPSFFRDAMENFLRGFCKKPRTRMQRRLRLALVAGEAQRVAGMRSNCAGPSTVNCRMPSKQRSVPAEEVSHREGRGRVLPKGLQCPGCGSTNTNLDRRVFGLTTFERHCCNDCGRQWYIGDILKKLPEAAYPKKGISIKERDGNRPFKTEDRIPPLSNTSAKGKEKECLGETSRGESNHSFQAEKKTNDLPLHEQSLNKGKSVIPSSLRRRIFIGECSKTAASPSAIPPTSSDELPNDHPLRASEGSLLHSSYLVVLAHKKVLIEQLVDYFERQPRTTTKFPDNWYDDLENQLMSNRHFLKRKGLFSTCEDLGQPPSKRLAKEKKKESSAVIGDRDRNLGGSSHARLTQERTPHLNLAVATSSRSTRSEDPDWTPSMENRERRRIISRGAQRGRRGPLQRQRDLLQQGNGGLPLPGEQCEWNTESRRCVLNVLEGERFCDHHLKQMEKDRRGCARCGYGSDHN